MKSVSAKVCGCVFVPMGYLPCAMNAVAPVGPAAKLCWGGLEANGGTDLLPVDGQFEMVHRNEKIEFHTIVVGRTPGGENTGEGSIREVKCVFHLGDWDQMGGG